MDLLTKIYGALSNSKLLLLVSDGAPYASKTGIMLKAIFPKMKHVTCIVNFLHRVCEKVRDISPLVNQIVSDFKRLLVKNKTNQKLYTQTTNISISKFPIFTRWGTCINFVIYMETNYQKILEFYNKLETDNKGSYLGDIAKFKEESCINELKVAQHSFIVKYITQLESESLSTEQQINIFFKCLQNISDGNIYSKIEIMLMKNHDLDFFLKFNSTSCNFGDRKYSYVHLTSVAVERSFSSLKFLLDDKRCKMKVETLEKLLFFYYNKF